MLTAIAARRSTRAQTTIRTIAIVIATLVIGLWAVVGKFVVTSHEWALKEAQSETRNLTIAVRDEVGYILRGVDGEMALLAKEIAAADGKFDLYSWGQRSVLVTPGVAQATFVGADGNLVSTTIEQHPSATVFGDREHFRVHVDGKFHGLYIGPTVTGRITHTPILPVSRRVEAPDGRFLGVLVVLIAPGALTSLHKSIDLGAHGVIALSGIDHRIRARFSADSPDGTKGLGSSVAGGPRPDIIAEGAEGFYVRTSVVDGIPRLYGYARVGAYPIIATVGLELTAELANARVSAATIALVAMVATILLIGLAAYLIREIRIRARRECDLARTNAELRQSTARAEAASQAKSMFLANMSHELRTPLNAIIGFSELIRDETFGPHSTPQYKEYADHVCGSGKRLLRLIADILDTAKIESGRMVLEEEPADARELIERALCELQPSIDAKRLQVETHIPAHLPTVQVDAARMTQVFANILSNAVKFTPKDGAITIGITYSFEAGMAFEVCDTGIGMSAEEIQIALEPFAQVENAFTKNYEGTGLGLPLASRLIGLHGGDLVIESVKGLGTTVRVTLPQGRLLADTDFDAALPHPPCETREFAADLYTVTGGYIKFLYLKENYRSLREQKCVVNRTFQV